MQSYTSILREIEREKIDTTPMQLYSVASCKGFLINNIDTIESGVAFLVREGISYISIAHFLLSD